MPSSLLPEPRVARRAVLGAGLALASLRGWAAQDADAEALLRKGGVVAAFRHSLAPGTFDPPGFRLGDCSTQRNLSEEGRAQARSVGAWFQQRQLQPGKVLSSPWCRCVDSATLAFGTPQVWAALGSPHGSPETTSTAHLRELRAALATASSRPGRFEAWFTHMFVLSDLANTNASSGEALILRADTRGKTEVLARLAVPA
ncbi:histidine phosphatase family protein [Acidovorax kalamii]|uniref:histidine phosphatase family protein n=1 Tax=Acidovorax kalamii TaxID=2004485 RepID=UPI002091815E|nr:histidine phosphatase family protein [Acidovorax kalamii]MCO5355326.1 histidine phosphatase family protein [Acidovorax kalamii]